MSRKIEGGSACPKCRHQMQRYEHGDGWKPKPGRYWFRWWDRCGKCGRFQHYEAAKVAASPIIEG